MMIWQLLAVEYFVLIKRDRRFRKPSSYVRLDRVEFVQCELVPVCCPVLLWLASALALFSALCAIALTFCRAVLSTPRRSLLALSPEPAFAGVRGLASVPRRERC